MNELAIQWSQGNHGALAFLMELSRQDEETAQVIGQCLMINYKIRGANLYVLWSDLCDRNIEKVKQLCENCPGDILTDACSRQDYSGKELINQYFK
ncbi:hypothetical protein [Zunongwangia profunda]|uniref:hypothetical protein n=1 Tax=Zunongwangia profunda TaxID=398743 RepID=UPI001D1892DC|nr:hypothetical protein [Zunongwangia profunda]MCC4228408.1 hypothetical protein [Zunongwangia profunda]